MACLVFSSAGITNQTTCVYCFYELAYRNYIDLWLTKMASLFITKAYNYLDISTLFGLNMNSLSHLTGHLLLYCV